MGRLIDADELIFLIKHKKDILSGIGGDEYSIKAFDYIIKLIEEQPTAYDVEKVVGEIRRYSGNGYRDVDGDYVPPLIKTEYAIDIVKRGGVDERA